jgi:hypothetical protein
MNGCIVEFKIISGLFAIGKGQVEFAGGSEHPDSKA